MTIEEFTTLLSTYGANLERWPAAQRDAGAAFLRASDTGQEKWEAARALDTLFRHDHDSIAVDPARQNAIVNVALRRIRLQPPAFSFDWRWLFSKPAGAIAATALLAGWLSGAMLGTDVRLTAASSNYAISTLLDGPTISVEDLL
jgi:anti-sigma factor RsiW